MALVEVKVPDIGDFADVSIIELLVKPGDTVKVEQSLITAKARSSSRWRRVTWRLFPLPSG